jgi:hypothetical protein
VDFVSSEDLKPCSKSVEFIAWLQLKMLHHVDLALAFFAEILTWSCVLALLACVFRHLTLQAELLESLISEVAFDTLQHDPVTWSVTFVQLSIQILQALDQCKSDFDQTLIRL